ncbi:MAG: hypothetical protein L6R40_001613 [Gallowayella cf. fulva]|nr:MAG: hypothetical protein L6R40_001613 [Xanthomendoza cf. fulva]
MDMLPGYYGDVVVFAPDTVAEVAEDIINWCQTSPRMPKLGGREVVGPEKKNIVILAGKIPEKGPKPPGLPALRILSSGFNSTVDVLHGPGPQQSTL